MLEQFIINCEYTCTCISDLVKCYNRFLFSSKKRKVPTSSAVRGRMQTRGEESDDSSETIEYAEA